MEKGLTTQQLIGNLVKVGHKSFDLYVPDGMEVAKRDPNLFAHLVSWNAKNTEIRDTKVAFPVIGLRGDPGTGKEYHENAVAHLLQLDPRNLLRSLYFHREMKQKGVDGAGSLLKSGVLQYLRVRESKPKWWDRTVLQHRKSMKGLYALNHFKPSPRAEMVLFLNGSYPEGSVLAVLPKLKNMDPQEAAGTILNHKIPFTIAIGALGGIKGKPDILLALIENMTASEILNNTNMLTKLGVMDSPALKAAYENGLKRVQKDKRVSSLKASKAASVTTDKKVKAKLESAQEEKLDSMKGMEGDWLVLGDKSGSMRASIEKAKEVSAFLARTVKGKVHLVFFNERPSYFDVSGKDLESVRSLTRGVSANGGTSIACGLELIAEKNILVNGIAICSDGGENRRPAFRTVYDSYCLKQGINPTVYLLHVPGDHDALSESMDGVAYEKIELSGMDYYGLPALAKILRSSRYSLVDEIMQSKLLTIQEVIGKEKENASGY